MANRLPDGIKKFKKAVNWFLQQADYKSPKVTVLAEIYQGTSELFPGGAEFSGDTDVSGGVCQGMAIEWIRMNALGVGGGSEGFRDQVESDWEIFAESQIAINHSKRCAKLLRKKLIKDLKKWEKAKSRFKVDKEASDEASLFKRIRDRNLRRRRIRRRRDVLARTGLNTAADLRDVVTYAQQIYSTRAFAGDADAGECCCVASQLMFSNVGVKLLEDQGNFPAYYMITFSGYRGHALALHTTQKPRLMDANGCEFQFDGPRTFWSFLNDYWQIYERAGLEDGRLGLYRFDTL